MIPLGEYACGLPWAVAEARVPVSVGERLVKLSERLVLEVYPDEAGYATVGWGHKVTAKDGLEVGDVITEGRAQTLFLVDYARACAAVKRTVGDLRPVETAVLASFVFNVGIGAFRGSEMVRWIKEGKLEHVPLILSQWRLVTVTENGKRVKRVSQRVSRGLVRRRAQEAFLWANASMGEAWAHKLLDLTP